MVDYADIYIVIIYIIYNDMLRGDHLSEFLRKNLGCSIRLNARDRLSFFVRND